MRHLEDLVYWIKERQAIHERRKAGQPPPWTKDEILRTYRFCNVRREDDRVTRWIHENWLRPNEARALVLFGRYAGSLKEQGFWWVNPFTQRPRVSIKVRNFESQHLKVNDHDGNPIEIAAVVVWRVHDTAEALFEVDDYEQFLKVQTEAAIRTLTTSYPYEPHHDNELSLRGNPHEVGERLQAEVQGRLQKAGIEVMDTRISHLAYAPEIANAMLRRQQASAVIDARTRIVEGAVSMVQMALDQLSEKHIVELDEERKATMVSNLLVVLCSEHETQPVVNTGTLYQ